MITHQNYSTSRLLMRYFRIIAFLLSAILNEAAVGQQYFIKSYAAENGLNTNIITDACQDKDGYMWFSTYLGISKYDGFTFKNFDTLQGLPEQHYRKIKCDEKGIIWAVPFANTGNLVFFDGHTWKAIKLPYVKKPYSYTTSLSVVYRNNSPVVCIGTYDGVDILENNKWKHYSVSDVKSNNIIFNITSKDGSFYLSTKSGVCELRGETLNWDLNKRINKTKEGIIAVKFENAGLPEEKIWILTSHSIAFFQYDKFTLVADNFFLEDVDLAHFPFLEIGKSGKILFGNNFSKYLLKASTSQVIPLKAKNGFSSNGATSVFIDREDNMWFTDSRGIDKISNIALVNYFQSSGMPEDEVTAIIETNDGRFVLGHNNRISILDDNKFKVIDLPGYQNSITRVLDMMKDREGNVWFSANTHGVGKLTANGRLQWYPSINGFFATMILQDSSGRIWIGSNSKLYYLKENKIIEYEHNALVSNSGFRKLYTCDKGGIYATGTYGLWHITNDTVIKIKAEDETQLLNAFSYYKDKNGTEFVGTMNGLYYVDNGIIKKFRNKKLYIPNPIYFILQDKENYYWIGTNNGVYKWDGVNNPEILNRHNGLAGRETNRSAGLIDSKGKIWIGTDRGLTCFDPGSKQVVTPIPLVNLLYTETSSGEKFSLHTPGSVSNTDNTLTFHFRGISFVNEDLLTYRYKLEGYDKDWREASQEMLDKIKYSNLKPGKYKLLVSAKNYSSSWSPVVYSKNIVIRPAIYMTWWFQLILLLTLVTMLWAFHSYTSQRLINKTLKKEIAERKQAEEKLRESEQRLSFIIEGSSLGTWDWDMTTNITHRNHLCSEMLGFTMEEAEQSMEFWTNLIHPDDKHMVNHIGQLHIDGKSPLLEVEYRILAKDKKYRWIQNRAMVVQRNTSGKALRMSGTHTDITKRKSAEDALQKSEERLRLLLASIPVVIFIAPIKTNFDLEMIAGNVETLTGYTEQEFLSGSQFWNRMHPDDRHRVKDAFNEATAHGGLTIEYRWQLHDGSYKWFHNHTIVTSNGYRQEYLGVFVDINDLKVAEQVIRNKNEQLNLINAEKDKLFSIISHDLRSPVSGFLGLTALLSEEFDKISTEQLREIISAMHTSAGKVNDLLNDLLEWSQLQRGLTILSPSVLNLKHTVDECIKLIAEQSGAKGINVINEIPVQMEITADVHLLQVVLRNLLTNAVKFTPRAGKVLIAASSENKQFVKISISDTGLGMNADLKSKLFKVNEKTGRKGTEGEPSSGLGLILCSEFVEKQNGKIWADSEEGKGSTFHFTIPFTNQ